MAVVLNGLRARARHTRSASRASGRVVRRNREWRAIGIVWRSTVQAIGHHGRRRSGRLGLGRPARVVELAPVRVPAWQDRSQAHRVALLGLEVRQDHRIPLRRRSCCSHPRRLHGYGCHRPRRLGRRCRARLLLLFDSLRTLAFALALATATVLALCRTLAVRARFTPIALTLAARVLFSPFALFLPVSLLRHFTPPRTRISAAARRFCGRIFCRDRASIAALCYTGFGGGVRRRACFGSRRGGRVVKLDGVHRRLPTDGELGLVLDLEPNLDRRIDGRHWVAFVARERGRRRSHAPIPGQRHGARVRFTEGRRGRQVGAPPQQHRPCRCQRETPYRARHAADHRLGARAKTAEPGAR
mmetsp:Transcript_95018/g.271680  ORF Transcript_95018/g.271680 Transcript_95018/m.271680 type:complete len:358 (+) Transcript_95018:770-1843(+)